MTGINKSKTESEFQEQVIKLIESKGGYVIKIHVSSYQSQGEPDLICCYLGRFIAFELKVKHNQASALQKYKIKAITKAGGVAKSARTLQEIEETLYEIFRVQQGGKSQ